jgi:hypothetical protein
MARTAGFQPVVIYSQPRYNEPEAGTFGYEQPLHRTIANNRRRANPELDGFRRTGF